MERPFTLDRMAISTGSHLWNKINNEKKIFYSHGKLTNGRSHVIIMDTSGYGKTQMHHFCLNDPDGILSDIIPTSQELKVSDEGWVGTKFRNQSDEMEQTQGLFSEMREGIVGIEEFTRFAYWCYDDNPSNLSQGEEYLMVGMDSSRVPKRLATGSMPIRDICTTIWGAMRYQKINFANGLARRCIYDFNYPTLNDALKYIKKGQQKKNVKISQESKDNLRDEIDRMSSILSEVQELDYSKIYSHNLFNSNNPMKDVLFPHFEREAFERMCIGYSIATGIYPELKITDELFKLLENERENREIISQNPLNEAVYRFIKDLNGEETNRKWIEKFLFKQFQLDRYNIRKCLDELQGESKIVKEVNHISILGKIN